MPNELETPEKRMIAKREIQVLMRENLDSAVALFERLDSHSRRAAIGKVFELRSIKHFIEKRADTLGHSRACKDSLVVCRGDCCRWHFPGSLTPADFFVALFSLTMEKKAGLQIHLSDFSNSTYQCPLLLEHGCFFSFSARPIACTNAYPCVSGEPFRAFRERQRPGIVKIFHFINSLFQQ